MQIDHASAMCVGYNMSTNYSLLTLNTCARVTVVVMLVFWGIGGYLLCVDFVEINLFKSSGNINVAEHHCIFRAIGCGTAGTAMAVPFFSSNYAQTFI